MKYAIISQGLLKTKPDTLENTKSAMKDTLNNYKRNGSEVTEFNDGSFIVTDDRLESGSTQYLIGEVK